MPLFASSINPATGANRDVSCGPSATSMSRSPITNVFGFGSASSVGFLLVSEMLAVPCGLRKRRIRLAESSAQRSPSREMATWQSRLSGPCLNHQAGCYFSPRLDSTPGHLTKGRCLVHRPSQERCLEAVARTPVETKRHRMSEDSRLGMPPSAPRPTPPLALLVLILVEVRVRATQPLCLAVSPWILVLGQLEHCLVKRVVLWKPAKWVLAPEEAARCLKQVAALRNRLWRRL